jgi:hypothetical protein
MPEMMTLNVRLSELIRRDKERVEAEAFDRPRAELHRAFAAPDDSYQPLNVDTAIARGRKRTATSAATSST